MRLRRGFPGVALDESRGRAIDVHWHDGNGFRAIVGPQGNSSAEPTFATTQGMVAMFEVFPRHMPAGAKAQCFLGHKGTTKPVR